MIYGFESYSLDSKTLQLWHEDKPIAVEPQVFSLLLCLIKNRSRVISKDELIDMVWDGRIVSDATLSSRINAARRAVGDTGREQRIIRTAARRGFQFVANVSEDTDETTVHLLSAKAQPGITVSLDLPDKPSIAVLPFQNMSGDPEQEYFSDGITEDIITELSRISGLFVIARNSSFVYKGNPVSIKQVGRELGVRYVLEGSVRKAGDQLRITAQLIDASTDHHIWVDRYDRELEDVFAVQDEVAHTVADALEIQLTARERDQAERRYTENMEAYDYFLRGRSYGQRSTADANLQARKMLERAIELDASFAGAYAILAHTHWRDWRNQWGQDPQPLESALTAAEKAVALDDSLPLAHAYLAWVYVFRNQHEKAIAEARRAISLDPGFAEGHGRLGLILSLSGNPNEGVGSVKKAMRLDPHYPSNFLIYLGYACYAAGKYEQAVAALKEARARNPDALGCNTLLAVIYGELGRSAQAEALVAEVLRVSPRASVRQMKERLPISDAAFAKRHFEGLCKAGLPE